MRGMVALVLVAVASSGCGRASVGDARDGLPAFADVAVPLPGDDTGTASGGLSQQPLLGQEADMYRVTRAVTTVVNGGVAWTLGLVKLISLLPPTTHVGDTFTWGPSEPKNLEAKNNWKLEITRNADGSWSYDLSGKRVEDGETGWKAVVSGTHVRGVPGKSGRGTLRLDFDAARGLHDAKADVGAAVATYGFEAGTGYQVAVDFKGVKDGNSGRTLDAQYRFQQPDAGPGSFEFHTEKDLRNDGAIESLVVRSRWQTTGRGRSDIQATGGSLSALATISECWDDSFGRTFASWSFDASKDEGVESACPFATAAFANL